MTEQEIAELRSRIAEVEDDFSRRANILLGESIPRPQPPPSFEVQLKALPPAVRSVAESLALRDMEGARRYVGLFLSANRGVKS